MMKKRIKTIWPIALLAIAGVAAYLNLNGARVTAAHQHPLAAERVSEELARTVSFGFVDDGAPAAASAQPAAAAALPATASM